MRCISDQLIQKYIDEESSVEKNSFVQSHIKTCSKCAEKVEEMRQTAGCIKNLIDLIDEKHIEIPTFKKPEPQKKIVHPNFTRFIYSVSAACILILFLFVLQKTKDEVELVYSYDLESEFNANLPVSEQEMEIIIIDKSGKLIKH